jgi:hypothetical protein
MKTFKSQWSYTHFAYSVRKKNRFIHYKPVNDFIKAITETCKKREGDIPKGSRLYRAQLGCGDRPVIQDGEHIDDENWPYKPKRMFPIKGKSFEGRANPRGITYLYLSNDRNTACAEVRPWKGAMVSLAFFKTKKDLKVVDCTKDINKAKHTRIYIKEPKPEIREKLVWKDINNAFSQPVNPNDPETEYVPTQIIAEIFKSQGFDGIAYTSSLIETGLNFVLFNATAVEMTSCWLTETKNIIFDLDHTKIGYRNQGLKKKNK